MLSSPRYDAVVVGAGFFGLYLAEHLAKRGRKVLLCEQAADAMRRASYANQARVHNGYHYPRSVLTALRSRVSFPRFVEEFRGCIDDTFEKYYLVARILSKVTAQQYQLFCRRIGAFCEPASPRFLSLVDRRLVEAAFVTVEYAFDALTLRSIMLERVHETGVTIQYETKVEKVSSAEEGGLRVEASGPSGAQVVRSTQVFNCTYSRLNELGARSGIELIPLKHEMTEMALVEPPEILKRAGVTVMCGPFFSVMPFPPRKLHSFSHVRYTPHYEWFDQPNEAYRMAKDPARERGERTAWSAIIHDAQRYLPVLADCRYQESMWEVKTVLPRSEVDDSRPILFRKDHGLKGYHCILGGKIDNVYDVVALIDQQGLA